MQQINTERERANVADLDVCRNRTSGSIFGSQDGQFVATCRGQNQSGNSVVEQLYAIPSCVTKVQYLSVAKK